MDMVKWFILEVRLESPMFQDVQDEADKNHFIGFKWHSHSNKWLHVGGEEDASHFSCSAQTLLWLLFEDQGKMELLNRLRIPFGLEHTMT